MAQRRMPAFDLNKLNVVGQVLSSFTVENDKQAIHAGEMVEKLDELVKEGHSDLEFLSDYILEQIQKYENTLPKEKVEPVEILRYLMEEHGHRQVDLADVAPKSVISAILSGKRQMSKSHIKGLSQKYSVSPAVFLG